MRTATAPSPSRFTAPPAALRQRVAAFDTAVEGAFDRLRGNPIADRVFYTASELGEFSLIWHLLGATRGLRSDADARRAVKFSACMGVESIVVNGLLKSAFRRTRPTWDQPRAYHIRRPLTSSFPSGHASAAFTAAAVLADDHPMAPLYYAAAAVVATSRIYVKIHHASDVVGGIAVGVALGAIAKRVCRR